MSKPRILIVDDDKSYIWMLTSLFDSKPNFEIVTSMSVDSAIKELETKEFALVISDYQMPGKTGLDLLRYLSAGRFPIPLLFYTSLDLSSRLADQYNYPVMVIDKRDYNELVDLAQEIIDPQPI